MPVLLAAALLVLQPSAGHRLTLLDQQLTSPVASTPQGYGWRVGGTIVGAILGIEVGVVTATIGVAASGCKGRACGSPVVILPVAALLGGAALGTGGYFVGLSADGGNLNARTAITIGGIADGVVTICLGLGVLVIYAIAAAFSTG